MVPSVVRLNCHIAPHLVPVLSEHLRRSGVLKETQAGPDEAFRGAKDRATVVVRRSGSTEYDPTPELQGLMVQSIKAVLPASPSSFRLGVDEAGIGGEAKQAHVGLVLLASHLRGDLIARGVRDCKKASSDAELQALASTVQDYALYAETQPVPNPTDGSSYAASVATVVGTRLLALTDSGQLPPDATITIDQTDEAALQGALGKRWVEFEPRLTVAPKAESEVEVAAASVLAKFATKPAAAPPKRRRNTELGQFHIGPHRAEDRDRVVAYLEQLEESYPDIAKWIRKDDGTDKVWEKVLNGEYRLTVARNGADVVGFCLGQQKDDRNAKISTFYVDPRWQRLHIGHRLLRRELEHLMATGVRHVMVTFGHEQYESMHSFFRKYGFTVEGISPQRYRDNSYEVVMGKRLHHATVDASGFHRFVEYDVFRLQGYAVDVLDDESFLANPRQSLFSLPTSSPGQRYYVRTTTRPDPEGLVDDVRKAAKSHQAYPVVASLYGFPADIPLPNGVLVLDALALEVMFEPIHIQRPDDRDLIIPIQPQFVRQLFPAPAQSTLQPSKLGLRTNNVYYRQARGHTDLRRGSRLFFYESHPPKGVKGRGVFGYGRLSQIHVASPKQLHSKHGGLGAWSAARIAEHTGGAKGAAYRFDAFNALERNIAHDDVKALHASFNPQTCYKVPRSVGDKLANGGRP